jgi:predicted acetyltransferase
MADMVSVDEVAKAMFKMVSETAGMKKWKASDLHKACHELFGDDRYDKRGVGKEAIKELIDSGQLVYTYFGGSFIEVPHREGAAND